VQSLQAFQNGQDPNGIWMLEICDAKANDKGKLRIFGLVFAPNGCMTPDSVAVRNVTTQSARVSWLAIPVTDSLLIEYGPAGYFPGSGGQAGGGGLMSMVAASDTAPLQLSGLLPLQWYELYARRRCASGQWSANSETSRFFTGCKPTMVQNFDSLALCPNGCTDPCPLPGLWQNASGDDYEWKVRTGPGLTFPTAGPPAGAGGAGNYLYFRNSCSPTGANGKKAILRSLCIQVVAPSDLPCHAGFDLYMNTKTGQMGTLLLQASTDGGQSWMTVKQWSGSRGKRWRREYVALGAFDGQITLFQFVATGVFGAYGDIAIDNVEFYGSLPAGTPDYTFYRDADGDGYGNPAQRIVSCKPVAPPGYVEQAGDCDDSNAAVHPGAAEVLCNQRDENCNGMGDDAVIPAPVVPAMAAICAGSDATLTISGAPSGQYYWFKGDLSAIPFAAGSSVTVPQVQNSTYYYVIDSVSGPHGGCASASILASVQVNLRPKLYVPSLQTLCLGKALDLADLPVTDSAKTNPLLTWYSAWPPSPAVRLTSTVVKPGVTTNYYVQGTTSDGCAGGGSVRVVLLPSPVADILQGDSIAACRGKTVLLTAQGADGTFPYAYAWSNGLNFSNIPVQPVNVPGGKINYTVTLTDANGCTATDAVLIATLPNISMAAILSVHNPSVCGGTDGSITLNPLDGVPPYGYKWSGSTTGSLSDINGLVTINGLMPGGYRVTVTDASGGCSVVMPFIVLNAPGLDVAVDTIIEPACPGAATGSIVLHIAGVNPVCHWSDGQTTSTATGLGAGTYAVTITDGGCARVLNGLEINTPLPVQIIRNDLQPEPCFNSSSGLIDLAVFGGTPPYILSWSNGATGTPLSGIPAGFYHATVTDSRGCVYLSPGYTVSQPAALQVNIMDLQDIACNGDHDARISVAAKGGTLPYHLAWNTGIETTELTNLDVGQYTVTVTDGHGCTGSAQASVGQPMPIALEKIYRVDPTCVGSADGRIEIQITGGVKPYRYQWNTGLPGDTAAILEHRDAGLYGVTVQDASGCNFVYGNVPLTAPQLIDLAVDSLVPVRCYGAATGSIAVSVTGTEGLVQYFWNDVPGTNALTGITAGQYQLRVTDSRHCAVSATYTVLQPAGPLAIGVGALTNAWCAGEPNGAVDVVVNGGTKPYAFEWSTGQTTEDLTAVPAGAYTLLMHDANGCYALLPAVHVGEPPTIHVTPSIQSIPCYGAVTGAIALSASGGVPPFVYHWSTGSSASQLYDLAKGKYGVTVQDVTGCAVVLDSLTVVDQGEAFGVQVTETWPVSCPGAQDGLIQVAVLNGVGPFQFLWSPPVGLHPDVASAADVASGLAGGGYLVTVVDAAGCHVVSPVILVEESPDLTVMVAPGDSVGTIAVQVTGGLPPYAYHWSNGDTTALVRGLPAGIYSLTVHDFRGCSQTIYPIPVGTVAVATPEPGWLMRLYPNPTNGMVWISVDLPDEQAIDKVVLADMLGRVLFIQAGYTTEKSVQIDLSDWSPGVYRVMVQARNGQVRSAALIKAGD
jgi:hypothetical protein